jgi:hypothetical protein
MNFQIVRYFADVAGEAPVPYDRYPFSIGVLSSPDKFAPIGKAIEVGRTEDGLALWRLRVGGRKLPCRWIIVDREFRAVDGRHVLA